MNDQFDFISPTDKPALLAVSTPEWLAFAESALTEAGFKVHSITSHSEFPGRFSLVAYQVVILEEQFAGSPLHENLTLQTLQKMPMSQRRHTTAILIGSSCQTFNSMQAFQQSVHAVVNYSEMPLIAQLVQKIIADNDMFLGNFREVQERIAHIAE